MKAPIADADFGKTADDYLTHRAGFPESLFSKLSALNVIKAGSRMVDIGTGTGTLGRGFARLGCEVTGVDPAASLLEAARTLDAAEGINTQYEVASAEALGLPDGSMDIVGAGQCWHWFDAASACSEIKRVLKPNGTLVVAYYDWLPLDGNLVRRTEELIERFNPAWRAGNLTGIHPGLFRDLGEAGFINIESFTYDEPAIYSHEGWRGRIRASAGVAATLGAKEVEAFDGELAALLQSDYPEEPLSVPHRVFAITAKPG